MIRPSIADLARAADVSASTVDRVLKGRLTVRSATAERVLAAAERIGFLSAATIRQRLYEPKPDRTFGFVLQQRSSRFCASLGAALTDAVESAQEVCGRSRVEYLTEVSAEAIAERLLEIGRSADALAVVAADHPRITDAVEELRSRRIPVFALISGLTARTAGYIGLDNWKVGRTAAWFVMSLAKRPGPVGILVGSHRYRCQDECEMSFRSFFREHAPEFRLIEPLVSLEDERYAFEALQDLLAREPDLTDSTSVAGAALEHDARCVSALTEGSRPSASIKRRTVSRA